MTYVEEDYHIHYNTFSLPDRPQSAHETIRSCLLVFLLMVSSPKQKSQYGFLLAGRLASGVGVALSSGGSWATGARATGGCGTESGVTVSPGWYWVICAFSEALVLYRRRHTRQTCGFSFSCSLLSRWGVTVVRERVGGGCSRTQKGNE